MTSTLTQLAQQKTAHEQVFLSRKSVAWFQDQTKDLKNPIKLAKEIKSERDRQKGRFLMGGLYHFFYDPITKHEMPYYDIFPLVIPLKRDSEGFIGLNLHYLPPKYRAIFLDKLMVFAITNDEDEPKRLRITYDILSSTQKFKEFRPCLKRYLNSQIRSKFMTIQPHEWETALFLPTAVFKGATLAKVHKESVIKAKSKVI